MAGLLILSYIVFFIFVIDRISKARKEKKQGFHNQVEYEKRIKREAQKKIIETRLSMALSNVPIIGHVFLGIKRTIYYITPYNENLLLHKSLVLFNQGILLGILAGIAAFFLNVIPLGHLDLVSLIVSLITVYIVYTDYIKYRIYNFEEQADSEFTRYLAYVKHEYYAHKKVGEAILTAAENVSYDMRVRARSIHNTAYSPNAKEAVYEYINCRDRGLFYRLFVTQVYHAGRDGDKWNGTESLFCKNIDYLRREIPSYRVRRKLRRAQFSGYTISILLPLIFMNILRKFGNGFSTDMEEFYQTTGYIIQIINIFVTFVVYNFFNKKKDLSNNTTVHLNNGIIQKIIKFGNLENFLKGFDNTFIVKKIKARLDRIGADVSPHTFLIKMVAISLIGFVTVVGIFSYGHATRRRTLSETIVYSDFMGTVSERQQESISSVTLEVINEFLSYDMSYVTESTVIDYIDRVGNIKNLAIKQEMAKTVIRQVNEYNSEILQWYEIVLAFLALFVGYVQYIELIYYDNMTKQAREDEVRMFQMIVLLEKEFDTTSVAGLLEEFEAHAMYFKEPLRVASLMYAKDKEKALDSLLDFETPEFVELITSLKTVYKCGIKAAFSETELNMISEAELQRVDEDITFKRSMDFADILRMFPAVITFGLYFLVPFLLSSLRGLKDVFDVLQNY
jgi:hypothetical protein